MREPRVTIGMIVTDLLADPLVARSGQGFPPGEDVARDVQGVVELGIDFGLVRAGAITLSLQGGALSRFRLERSDNDALSVDYMVALPIGYVGQRWQARARLIHRSAHLGDEVVLHDGLRRLEYDHEEIDALVARVIGPIRVYAGGTLTLASSFEEDDWGVQLGADGGVGRGTWKLVGGIDWQRHSINNGNSRLAAVAGVQFTGGNGRLSLQGTFSTGASPLGEFFLERERFWGLRVVLDALK